MQELEALCAQICEFDRQAMVTNIKAETTLPANENELANVSVGNPVPEPCVTLTISTASNLRRALDCLARSVSELDSGNPQLGAKFPIESGPDGFRRQCSLMGINVANEAIMEQLQPYRGCNWTNNLNSIENLRAENEPIFHNPITGISIEPKNDTAPNAVKHAVKVDVDHTLFIAIGDGLPLIETLKEIEAGVAKTIELFEPIFDE